MLTDSYCIIHVYLGWAVLQQQATPYTVTVYEMCVCTKNPLLPLAASGLAEVWEIKELFAAVGTHFNLDHLCPDMVNLVCVCGGGD